MIILIWLLFPLYLVKLVRWLALVQQKEYRWDRIISFILTDEGAEELVLLPQPKLFTKTGLKRPVRTIRAWAQGVTATVILSAILIIWTSPDPLIQIGIAISVYFLIPMFTLAATLPWSLASSVWTLISLIRAKNKLVKAKPLIIGITGSYGKTSTKLLLAAILGKKYRVFTTERSHNTKLSIATDINRRYRGEETVIIEYAAYKTGEIKELSGWFRPKIALITGIAPQHYGLFGSLDKIIAAKAELAQAVGREGKVFYNGESRLCGSVCKKAKVKAEELNFLNAAIREIKTGITGRMSLSWRGKEIKTKLAGKQYAETVLLAAETARYLKVPEKQIAEALEKFDPTDSFIKTKIRPDNTLVIDDSGTANPKGFEAICNLAGEIEKNKKILFFGGIVDLGKKSDRLHLQLANASRPIFAKVIYTGKIGEQEFRQIYQNDLLVWENRPDQTSDIIGPDSLLVFEGRIPKQIAGFFGLKQI